MALGLLSLENLAYYIGSFYVENIGDWVLYLNKSLN